MVRTNIDTATGALKAGPAFWISKATTPQDLLQYFGEQNAEVIDFKNGGVNYTLRNVEVDDQYFTVTIYFRNNLLSLIHFIVGNAAASPGSWDDWSEAKELADRDYYDQWLTENMGEARTFPWGTIGAFYDPRSGSSGITINYA